MLTVVRNPQGFHLLDCLQKGQKGNAGYFIFNILQAIREKPSVAEDDGNRKLAILADNACLQASRLISAFCDENFIQMTPHSSVPQI
jgi:hypothetical protein